METTFLACRNSYEWIAVVAPSLYSRLEKACCINAGCGLQRTEMVIDRQRLNPTMLKRGILATTKKHVRS